MTAEQFYGARFTWHGHEPNTLLKKLLASAADFLVPKRCVVCRRPGDFICPFCRGKISYLETPVCPVCTRAAIDGFAHPGCRRKFTLDRAIIPFRYHGPIAAAIKKLKYRKITALADFLAVLLLEFMKGQDIAVGGQALIVPVPLYPFKEWERGFNQAELLARSLGRRLNLAVADKILLRIRETPSQTRLKGPQREKNVRGAFRVEEERKAGIRGRDLILVDDVFTTGATLRECGRVLKRAGARFIYALALAKD